MKRLIALAAVVGLVLSTAGCTSFMLKGDAKPATPVQFFVVAIHDYTLLATAVSVYIDSLTARAHRGDVGAFRRMPLAEGLAVIVGEGAVVMETLDAQLRECTGRGTVELAAGGLLEAVGSALGLGRCSNLKAEVLIALGDLRGVISRLRPRLAAARGEI